MDHEALEKYFSTLPDSEEVEKAYLHIRIAAKPLAETLNKYLAETPAKADLIGRLFRVMCDAELAIRMDGVSQTKPMIVRN